MQTFRAAAICLALAATPFPGWAQTTIEPGLGLTMAEPDPQTLADIRSELEQLRAEIDGLRQELILNNPAVSGIANPQPVLDRVNALEAGLQQLTAQTEELRFRIEQIVTDGTNRIGDLEFRLTELEGGDFSTLGETRPLGSGPAEPASPPAAAPAAPTAPPATSPAETAAPGGTRPVLRGESPSAVPPPPANPAPQAEAAQPAPAVPAGDTFETALQSYRSGDFFAAERAFAQYLTDNPGGPRAGEAAFWRGEALAATGDWSRAARSYLDSFSGSPRGEKAPEALYRLGVSLGRLGRQQEACLTLSEVTNRYPDIASELRAQTESERRALGCAG
ncbi:tol-pal system protein YbgF [Halovulum dunhuangense]|uniref:Cell division coordinator CpoB n=1 Tax=Halovulum dunhuangense TaxID=1505036 RepID=A0A849L540_9RHOB|nr:tol-pal system protein YbgF [Halovulum dunhuangense]NNU81261.1 tol-pal system protein YbgF [Halovulum dunhuangense]